MRMFRQIFLATEIQSFVLSASGQGNESPTITFINQGGEN
jgi:hypothetical protein